MKLTLRLFLFISAISATFISCEKPEPDEPPAPQRSNFYATISNRSWDADLSFAKVVNGRLQIYGASAEGRTLEFDLDSAKEKKYKINSTSASKVFFTDSNLTSVKRYDSKVNVQYTGEITVTKHDVVKGLVSGNFNLILRNIQDQRLLAVENGSFTDISYGDMPDEEEITGDTLFVGLYEGGTVGLAYYKRTPEQGIVRYNWISGEWTGTLYGVGFDKKNRRYINISDAGYANYWKLKEGTKTDYTLEFVYAPVFLNDKFYCLHYPNFSFMPYVAVFSPDNQAITEVLDTVPVLDEFSLDNTYSTTDGTNLYFSNNGKLVRYNPATRQIKSFSIGTADQKQYGLEYIGNNTFLQLNETSGGAGLEKLIIENDVLTIQRVTTFGMGPNDFTYNSKLNKVYTVEPISGGSIINEINMTTLSIQTDTLPGITLRIKSLY